MGKKGKKGGGEGLGIEEKKTISLKLESLYSGEGGKGRREKRKRGKSSFARVIFDPSGRKRKEKGEDDQKKEKRERGWPTSEGKKKKNLLSPALLGRERKEKNKKEREGQRSLSDNFSERKEKKKAIICLSKREGGGREPATEKTAHNQSDQGRGKVGEKCASYPYEKREKKRERGKRKIKPKPSCFCIS